MTNATEQKPQAPLIVKAQYAKTLSFENSSPRTRNQGQPTVSVNVDVQGQNVSDRTFEITLHTQVDGKHNEDQAFILNLDYAGVFTIGNEIKEEYIRPLLMIECPRILFPFVRKIVATTTHEGGYPALRLTTIDFVALYKDLLAKEQIAGKTVSKA